ncbi:hypothetical protein M9Y53_20940, partial [Klebsiella pneumoniae]|nr:hypothetical protein [Klebsiella pneumoniae]
ANKYNSLLISNTTNRSWYLSHKVDEFICIEMPQVGKAFLLCMNKEFAEHKDAHAECMEIIKKVYND